MLLTFLKPSLHSITSQSVNNAVRTRLLTVSTVTDRLRKRRLDVAIVGAPNSGKSQLLNAITKSSVAAVSRKRHTTRTEILGAVTNDDTQIVFFDTPGYLNTEKGKVSQSLINNAVDGLGDVDFTLLVIDAAKRLTKSEEEVVSQLMTWGMQSKGRVEECDDIIIDSEISDLGNDPKDCVPKVGIVLNKVDLVKPKSSLLDTAIRIGELADSCLVNIYGQMSFDKLMKVSPVCFYISALKETGTQELLKHLQEMATPCSVWAIEDGQVTSMDDLERIEEIIREKIYRQLHREIPHSVHQRNALFQKVEQGIVIHQDLIVSKKSHVTIIKGRSLQRIEDLAVKDLTKIFGCDVFLKLKVKLSSTHRRNAEESTALTLS